MKKIVIIGPESTGKSTLCTLLANHFNTLWVREYAREYLLANGTDYTVQDLYTIAQGQLKNENAGLHSLQAKDAGLLFVDTDFKVIQVWSEYVFNCCNNQILKQIAKDHCDLYLLCNTDLPWVADELREYPDLETREKLFNYYHQILIDQQVPWVLIAGDYDKRLATALAAVKAIL